MRLDEPVRADDLWLIVTIDRQAFLRRSEQEKETWKRGAVASWTPVGDVPWAVGKTPRQIAESAGIRHGLMPGEGQAVIPQEFRRLIGSGVFTVGNEEHYDRGIREHGRKFMKSGRSAGYSGGFACRTAADAERLIDDRGKRGEWAVYKLDADWDRDTVPSENGWWHALVNSARVVGKVPSPEDAEKVAAVLQLFREIADDCTEEECLLIMEDCDASADPFIRGRVREVYQTRLDTLSRQREAVEHHETVQDRKGCRRDRKKR